MNNFNFEENKQPLYEMFKADEEIVNISNVWHEMGHAIGNLVCKKIGFYEVFGNVKEIHLLGVDDSKIVYDKHFLHIENAKIIYDKTNLDFYGYPNVKYLDSSNEIILKKIITENPKRFFNYLIQLFSGGLFNIFCLETNPDFDYFDRCFSEYDVTYLDRIEGRAGNDWTKCRKYGGYLKADLGEMIHFRNELFDFFKEYNFFEFFKNLIEEVGRKFNNKIIKDEELSDILLKIEEILNRVDKRFFEELSVKINFCLEKFS